jgi:hypothetical protein
MRPPHKVEENSIQTQPRSRRKRSFTERGSIGSDWWQSAVGESSCNSSAAHRNGCGQIPNEKRALRRARIFSHYRGAQLGVRRPLRGRFYERNPATSTCIAVANRGQASRKELRTPAVLCSLAPSRRRRGAKRAPPMVPPKEPPATRSQETRPRSSEGLRRADRPSALREFNQRAS